MAKRLFFGEKHVSYTLKISEIRRTNKKFICHSKTMYSNFTLIVNSNLCRSLPRFINRSFFNPLMQPSLLCRVMILFSWTVLLMYNSIFSNLIGFVKTLEWIILRKNLDNCQKSTSSIVIPHGPSSSPGCWSLCFLHLSYGAFFRAISENMPLKCFLKAISLNLKC